MAAPVKQPPTTPNEILGRKANLDKEEPPKSTGGETNNEADIALREEREKIQRIASMKNDPSPMSSSPDVDFHDLDIDIDADRDGYDGEGGK
jgi:hypothetical protein